MSEGIADNAHRKRRRSRPGRPIRLTFHLHRMQHNALLHRVLVSGCGSAAQFECFGDLTKALAFSPQRSAGVAERCVSERVGLIHAFDAGHDFGPQQQSTLFDQLGHFREAKLGVGKDLRGAVLGGLGNRNIIRVHLLHGPFQGCNVVDHRKTSSGDSRVDGAISSPSPVGATRRCRSRPIVTGLAGRRPRSGAALSTLFIGTRRGYTAVIVSSNNIRKT